MQVLSEHKKWRDAREAYLARKAERDAERATQEAQQAQEQEQGQQEPAVAQQSWQSNVMLCHEDYRPL